MLAHPKKDNFWKNQTTWIFSEYLHELTNPFQCLSLPIPWNKLETFLCTRPKIYFNKSPNLAKSCPQSTLFAEGAREKYLKRLHFIPKQLKYLKPFIPKQLKYMKPFIPKQLKFSNFPLSKHLKDFIHNTTQRLQLTSLKQWNYNSLTFSPQSILHRRRTKFML